MAVSIESSSLRSYVPSPSPRVDSFPAGVYDLRLRKEFPLFAPTPFSLKFSLEELSSTLTI